MSSENAAAGVLNRSHKFAIYSHYIENSCIFQAGRRGEKRSSAFPAPDAQPIKNMQKSRLKYSRLEMQQSEERLDVSVYFMRTKATSADIHSLDLSVNQYANSLDVRFPGSLCFQMGMGYIESRSGSLAANFTIVSHVLHLLALPRLQHSYYITTLFLRKYFTAEYLKNYNKSKGSTELPGVKRREALWQEIVTAPEPRLSALQAPVDR